ncbi:MAG: RNA-binding S4 domain-containing protein [Acidobacteriota bacterium]
MDTRLDKWLWAARIYKTRGIASDSCKSGKVLLNGSGAKPSKIVNEGDIIEIKQPPITRRYKVKGLAVKRVSAKLAVDLVEDITPEEEINKLKQFRRDPVSVIFGHREKGAGRPSKKERRDIEKLMNGPEEIED